jgi:hypothetical protein
MFGRKREQPFDFEKVVLEAVDKALGTGMNRRAIIDRLKRITEAQEHLSAVTYRSDFLPPITFDAKTIKQRT